MLGRAEALRGARLGGERKGIAYRAGGGLPLTNPSFPD